MKLTKKFLRPYLDFVFAEESKAKREELEASWTLQIESGQKQLSNYFIAHSADGKVEASVHVFPFHESTYGISLPTQNISCVSTSSKDVALLLEESVARLKELGATRGEFRLTEKPHLLQVADQLPELGFKKSHTRIEFRANLSELPNEVGTPLTWVPISMAGPHTLLTAAQILEQAGEGDPDWNSEDNNESLLRSYLEDEEFKSTLDCVHIGLLNGEPAAIVVAQVIPESGWSRITYMGLLPKFRKNALGQWVHRHGFEMMRKQGGKMYHGGTVLGNKPMEALFRRHGCTEYRTMQEWAITLRE